MVAMDDVETHEQRNAETGFLDRKSLDNARFVRAPEVEQVSDPPGSNPLLQVSKLAGTGHHAGRSDHIELPDLFLERHLLKQCVGASHALALSPAASRRFRSAILEKQTSQAASADATVNPAPEHPPRRRGRIMRE